MTREGKNARVCPGMKAACAAAAKLVQGSAAEKGEVLRLSAQRHCLEKGRVCGPYSKAEAALVVKGEVALAIVLESQQQDRDREAAQQQELAERQRGKAQRDYNRLLAVFEKFTLEDNPGWGSQRVRESAVRQVRLFLQVSRCVKKHQKGKREAFPELSQGGSKRVRPGADFSSLPERALEDPRFRPGIFD